METVEVPTILARNITQQVTSINFVHGTAIFLLGDRVNHSMDSKEEPVCSDSNIWEDVSMQDDLLSLRVERDVLDWLVEQLKYDEIEEVTDEILDNLIEHHPILIAAFYDDADKTSLKCLSALESIDDDLDEHKIPAVKMSDTAEARQYGVKSFPSIIVFVKKIPELYQGNSGIKIITSLLK